MHKFAKEKWVVKDGCIWTAEEHEVQLSKYVRVKARQLVSPNMGELAEYLTRLHNENLDVRIAIAASPPKSTGAVNATS